METWHPWLFIILGHANRKTASHIKQSVLRVLNQGATACHVLHIDHQWFTPNNSLMYFLSEKINMENLEKQQPYANDSHWDACYSATHRLLCSWI